MQESAPPPAPPSPSTSLLQLPEVLLRLILHRLPLAGRVAASHSCQTLRRLLTIDIDPHGFASAARVVFEPPNTAEPRQQRRITLVQPDVEGENGFEGVVTVTVRSADPEAERAALVHFLTIRLGGISSVEVIIPRLHPLVTPDAQSSFIHSLGALDALLASLTAAMSDLGQDPSESRPPLTLRLGAPPAPLLPGIASHAAAVAYRPLSITLKLAATVGVDAGGPGEAAGPAVPAAVPVPTPLSSFHTFAGMPRLTCFSLFTALGFDSAALAALTALPSITLEIETPLVGDLSMVFAPLASLSGLQSLTLPSWQPESPAWNAVLVSSVSTLSHLTHLDICFPQPQPLPLPPAPLPLEPASRPLHDLLSQLPRIKSLALRGAVPDTESAPPVGRLPSTVLSLSLALSVLSMIRPLQPIAFNCGPAFLSNVGTHVTSLELQLNWLIPPPPAAARAGAGTVPVSAALGPSLEGLRGLKSLRVVHRVPSSINTEELASAFEFSTVPPPELGLLTGLSRLYVEGLGPGALSDIPPPLRDRVRWRERGLGLIPSGGEGYEGWEGAERLWVRAPVAAAAAAGEPRTIG